MAQHGMPARGQGMTQARGGTEDAAAWHGKAPAPSVQTPRPQTPSASGQACVSGGTPPACSGVRQAAGKRGAAGLLLPQHHALAPPQACITSVHQRASQRLTRTPQGPRPFARCCSATPWTPAWQSRPGRTPAAHGTPARRAANRWARESRGCRQQSVLGRARTRAEGLRQLPPARTWIICSASCCVRVTTGSCAPGHAASERQPPRAPMRCCRACRWPCMRACLLCAWRARVPFECRVGLCGTFKHAGGSFSPRVL